MTSLRTTNELAIWKSENSNEWENERNENAMKSKTQQRFLWMTENENESLNDRNTRNSRSITSSPTKNRLTPMSHDVEVE